MTKPTASDTIKIAREQVGVYESPAGSNRQKYGKAFGMNGQPWCAEFVWWCGWKAAGKNQANNPIAKSASAAYIQDLTVSDKGGKWIMKKNTSASTRKAYLKKAKKGDIVSFDFGAYDAIRDHVGIVDHVDGDHIICIEGNTSKAGSQSNGGMVCKQKRPYSYICSAVRPAYGRPADKYQGTLPTKTVKKGYKGEAVKVMQEFLNWALKGAWATEKYTKLEITGKTDKATLKAIRLFKDIHHLPVNTTFSQDCCKIAKKMRMNGRRKAVNWAVATARDNSFAYGEGSGAHNYGCHYCGTNYGPRKYKKPSAKYERTYCCNPFVHAAYAHGAKNKRCLSACRAGGGGGTSPGTWTRYGCFKTVGKCKNVPFSKLKPGDLVMKSGAHVWMYTGDGWLVEASSGNWSASSIAHKKIAKNRYSDYRKSSKTYVVRFTS